MPVATTAAQINLDALFKALASQQRREILAMLSEHSHEPCGPDCAPAPSGEVCACKFAERLGLSAPTISHHMSILRDAGLVSARKEGLWVYYSLRREALGELTRYVAAL